MAAKRTNTISKLTKTLLAEGESERVDFKRTPDGITVDDLVSFANTETGGWILAGIDEQAGRGGAQIGAVRGCDVTDTTILQITNKALSCIPPISIEVFIENLGTIPFLRVAISASTTRPHCTPRGTYCRRDEARNRPLHPAELLKIFLESEARAFAEKFESAANQITTDLNELEMSLHRSIRSMADELGWADSRLGETESTLSAVLAYEQRLNDEINDVSARLRALFQQDSREDPVHAQVRKQLIDKLVKQLKGNQKLYKKMSSGTQIKVELRGKETVELNKEEMGSIVNEAMSIVKEHFHDAGNGHNTSKKDAATKDAATSDE